MNNTPHGNGNSSVELRSDASGGLPGGKSPGKMNMNKKMVGIVIGVVVLVAIVGAGVYAAMKQRPATQPTGETKDNGIFGLLPNNDEKKAEVHTTSGLSGVTCEHPDRRAIGVMLAGDPINRPMSGFSQADMVWELPVLTSNQMDRGERLRYAASV